MTFVILSITLSVYIYASIFKETYQLYVSLFIPHSVFTVRVLLL